MKKRKRMIAWLLSAAVVFGGIQTSVMGMEFSEDSSAPFETEFFAQEEIGTAESDSFFSGETEDAEPEEDICILSHEGIIQEGAIGLKETSVILLPEWENGLISCLESDISPYDISNLSIPASQISDVLMLFLNRHPEYYWASFDVCETENGIATLLYEAGQVMTFSVEQGSQARTIDTDDFNHAVEEALSCVESGMSDLEKALVLHDYLALNTEYDYENFLNGTIPGESYTAAGVLVNKVGVCQGYSLAYQLLLKKCGIESEYVSSMAMNHGWNLVNIGGSWYHVDVTWDDPVPDSLGAAYHTYFMVSDKSIGTSHYGWTAKNTAGSEMYDDAFWKSMNSVIWYSGGEWYFINSDTGEIQRQKIADNTSATIEKITDTWPVVDKPGYYWIGCFSKLVMKDRKLYYNTPTKIYRMNLDGTGKQEVASPSLKDVYIYGLAYKNGGFFISEKNSPNVADKVVSISLNEPDMPAATPTPTPAPTATPTPIPVPTATPTPTVIQTPQIKSVTPSYSSITLKWDAVSNASGYQVYRKVDSGKWTKVKTTSALSYKDTNVKAGYKYTYSVRAYGKINGKTLYSALDGKGKTGSLTTIISVKNNTSKAAVLTWKATKGATGYYIYRATSENGKFKKIKTITSSKTVSYVNTKLTKGRTYYYKIVPYGTVNGKKIAGTASAVKSVKIKK